MQKFLLPSLLMVAVTQTACGKNSSDKKSEGQPPLAVTQTPSESPILGFWSFCLPMLPPDGEGDAPFPKIKSVLRSMAFDPEGRGFEATAFYTDEGCKVEFGPSEVQAYIKEFEDWLKGQGAIGLPPEAREDLTEEFSPHKDTFQYRLETPQAIEGDLDLIYDKDGKATYTRYKVSGRMLQVADTCDAETVASGDDPDCPEVTGESPDHRPTEYSILLFK